MMQDQEPRIIERTPRGQPQDYNIQSQEPMDIGLMNYRPEISVMKDMDELEKVGQDPWLKKAREKEMKKNRRR